MTTDTRVSTLIQTSGNYTDQPKHWTVSESECETLATATGKNFTTQISNTQPRGCSLDSSLDTNYTENMYYNRASGRFNGTSQRYQVYNDREPWCTSSDVDTGTGFTKCKGWRESCNFNPSSSWQDHFNNPASCT